jgi:glycosyltransferase involved in cell wall biosynthesis
MYIIYSFAATKSHVLQTMQILTKGFEQITFFTDLPYSLREKLENLGANIIKCRVVFPRITKFRGITAPLFSHYVSKHNCLKKGMQVLIFDEIFSSSMIHAIFAKKILNSVVYIYCFENLPFPIHLRVLGKFFSRYIDGALCSSKETAEQLNKLGVINTHICPHPIREIRLEQIKKVNRIKIVGFIGRLVKEKGILELCEAMKNYPEKKLYVAGSGKLANEVQKYNINYFGQLPLKDIDTFYSNIDLLVVPSQTTRSWAEQYGRVIVEAMARGIIVIGSDSGAIPEIISNDSLIFKEQSVDSIVEKIHYISHLTESELLKLSIDLRKRYEEMFSNNVFQRIIAELTGCQISIT